MNRWLLLFAVLGIVVAARPASPLAEDESSPERPECLEGALAEQEKAIESRSSSPPFMEKIEPVRAVLAVPEPFMASPGQTRAKCPAFPRIPWWKNDTHRKAIRYVNSRYGGDWNAYAAKWKKYLDKVADAFVKGKKAFIRKANVTLKGEDYIDYINKIEKRISVIRCLSRKDVPARR